MDASSSSTRRDRLVMGLSIAALLLFAANMLTMVKKHFFEKDSHHHVEMVDRVEHDAHMFVVRPHHERAFSIHISGDDGERTIDWEGEMELEHDMMRLQADMERMAQELRFEFEGRELHELNLDELGLQGIQIDILGDNLERLEEFEIQVSAERQAIEEAAQAVEQAVEEASENVRRRKRRVVVRATNQ